MGRVADALASAQRAEDEFSRLNESQARSRPRAEILRSGSNDTGRRIFERFDDSTLYILGENQHFTFASGGVALPRPATVGLRRSSGKALVAPRGFPRGKASLSPPPVACAHARTAAALPGAGPIVPAL
jgi:hypothetical protein